MQKSITTYEGPGRARKQCPNGHYVHAKQATCICGYQFREVVDKADKQTVYEEAGKGRKPCPNCNKYVGVRSQTCPNCDFNFTGYVHEPEKVEAVTYTEGGKGRKQCPSCSKYVGCRVKECVCGYDFESALVEPEVNVAVDLLTREESTEAGPLSFRDLLGYPHHRTTYTPAGICPVKLHTHNREEVLDWIEKIQKHFIAKGEVLAPSGFTYFARDFFDIGSAEYNTIKQIVRDHFANLSGRAKACGS